MCNENLALREEIDRSSMYETIVGSSEALRRVLLQVDKVAPTDSTVLILGETGTGKELIASAIHKRSRRSARAFIRVNCTAIPASLVGSELFGHEKGAFTGAIQRRAGRFESADGGTIFLDEIGELSPETQLALLRVLQERELERVGSNPRGEARSRGTYRLTFHSDGQPQSPTGRLVIPPCSTRVHHSGRSFVFSERSAFLTIQQLLVARSPVNSVSLRWHNACISAGADVSIKVTGT
jgi:hypothetical protein